MDPLEAKFERIFREKEARSHECAKLPIEEKIRSLDRMQERRAVILRQRGQDACAWKIDPPKRDAQPIELWPRTWGGICA